MEWAALGTAATLTGCATSAIKGTPISQTTTGNEDLVFPENDMKHTLALEQRLGWDSPVAAASRRGWGDNQSQEQALRDIDGKDSQVSKLDYMVNKAVSGVNQLPNNIIPRVPVADRTNPGYIWSNVEPSVVRQIFRHKPTAEPGGCALYMPESFRLENGSPRMDIAFAPQSNNPLLRARWEGIRGSLESYLGGKEFDNVRAFNISQRGKVLRGRNHIANLETYTFADAPGIVTLKRDLTQNGFNVSPVYVGPETLEAVEALSKDGKPVPEDQLSEIAYLHREKYQGTRHLESLLVTGGAGAFMAGTPVGWVLTAGVGANMLMRNLAFDNVTDYMHETVLSDPKDFDVSEVQDMVNPNVNSYYDGPKVVVPVFNPADSKAVGLAVYSFAQPGEFQSYFEPDGSLTVTEPYKRALWTAGNIIQTAIVVGSYLAGKNEWDQRDDCDPCPGLKGGEDPHVPISGGETPTPSLGGGTGYQSPM